MDGDRGLSELRFEGYDNEKLAQQVEGLGQGVGSRTLRGAVEALVGLSDGLADTDDTLRKQLKDVGVTWQGQAASGGTEATEHASIYADEAHGPVRDTANSVETTSDTFSSTQYGAPNAATLRGPSQENFGDRVLGAFGHTTDHAKAVQATGEARQEALDGMNNYRDSSVDALGQSSKLPVPPGMSLVAEPVDAGRGTTHVSGFTPDGGLGPSGGGPLGGGGPGGLSGPGGGESLTTTPPTGPPVGGGPGQTVGIGPFNQGGLPTVPGGGGATPLRSPVNPMMMADAATVMGAGGASGAGAGATGERTIRGTGGRAGVPGRSTPLGAADEEEARAARNAERFGARTGRPGSSIMQPATGRKGEGEDDQEHVRRYGIDSGDVFDDERVVAPEAIGDDRP